ncbi:MAG: hypothetical protein M3Y48_14995 [Actinomycetota bacterium]|nr:hypothetical protein [Actinomycetota bacterium]
MPVVLRRHGVCLNDAVDAMQGVSPLTVKVRYFYAMTSSAAATTHRVATLVADEVSLSEGYHLQVPGGLDTVMRAERCCCPVAGRSTFLPNSVP